MTLQYEIDQANYRFKQFPRKQKIIIMVKYSCVGIVGVSVLGLILHIGGIL